MEFDAILFVYAYVDKIGSHIFRSYTATAQKNLQYPIIIYRRENESNEKMKVYIYRPRYSPTQQISIYFSLSFSKVYLFLIVPSDFRASLLIHDFSFFFFFFLLWPRTPFFYLAHCIFVPKVKGV